jgi:hypothetical protein
MGAIPDFETAMTIIRDLETQVAADDLARLDWSMSKETIRCLKEDFAVAEAQVAVLREKARTTIDRFQDILGWQPEESRNALICEIRDAVDAALAQTAPKEAQS